MRLFYCLTGRIDGTESEVHKIAGCDFAQRVSAARRAPAMDGRREILSLIQVIPGSRRPDASGQAAG